MAITRSRQHQTRKIRRRARRLQVNILESRKRRVQIHRRTNRCTCSCWRRSAETCAAVKPTPSALFNSSSSSAVLNAKSCLTKSKTPILRSPRPSREGVLFSSSKLVSNLTEALWSCSKQVKAPLALLAPPAPETPSTRPQAILHSASQPRPHLRAGETTRTKMKVVELQMTSFNTMAA